VGAIGEGVETCLAQRILNHAFSGGSYCHAMDAAGGDVAQLIKAASTVGMNGLCFSASCEAQVLPLLDALEPAARALSSADTVAIEGNRLVGHSTRAAALQRVLRGFLVSEGTSEGVESQLQRVVVVGSGVVQLFSPTDAPGAASIVSAVQEAASSTSDLAVLDRAGLQVALGQCSGVLFAEPGISCRALGVSEEDLVQLPPEAWLVDTAFEASEPTLRGALLRKAAQQGHKVCHGGVFFVWQCHLQLAILRCKKVSEVVRGGEVTPEFTALLHHKPAPSEEDLVQNMELRAPSEAHDGGTKNYAVMQQRWLEGPRTASGECLEEPDEMKKGMNILLQSKDSSRQLLNPIPLQAVLHALGDQWIQDHTL